MHAGADFIKTSTGKVPPAATLPVTLVMLEAIRDYFFATGIRIGMKPAGGIRTAKEALAYSSCWRKRSATTGSRPTLPLRRQHARQRRAHADRQDRRRQLPKR